MSLKCSALYLSQFRHTSPHLLAGGDDARSATIIGDVYIHPSAKVHPSAKASFSLFSCGLVGGSLVRWGLLSTFFFLDNFQVFIELLTLQILRGSAVL